MDIFNSPKLTRHRIVNPSKMSAKKKRIVHSIWWPHACRDKNLKQILNSMFLIPGLSGGGMGMGGGAGEEERGNRRGEAGTGAG